jgi:hypothetical protein
MRRLLIAILFASLIFGASCRSAPVILRSDERIFVVENGAPVFDGKVHAWSEVEGWFLVSPGNVQKYLQWLRDVKKRESEGELDAGTNRSADP